MAVLSTCRSFPLPWPALQSPLGEGEGGERAGGTGERKERGEERERTATWPNSLHFQTNLPATLLFWYFHSLSSLCVHALAWPEIFFFVLHRLSGIVFLAKLSLSNTLTHLSNHLWISPLQATLLTVCVWVCVYQYPVSATVCVCVCACERACERACVRVWCVRACRVYARAHSCELIFTMF